MRFSGRRQVAAPTATVWATLHDRCALRSTIPGCRDIDPLAAGVYTATLEARVGPVADTYRGRFCIEDLHPGADLRVRVGAKGRCGRLDVDLRVSLSEGPRAGTTMLRYVADASVSGLVSRLGRPTLTVAGSHFTACFFRDLDRSIRHAQPVQGDESPHRLVPQPA